MVPLHKGMPQDGMPGFRKIRLPGNRLPGDGLPRDGLPEDGPEHNPECPSGIIIFDGKFKWDYYFEINVFIFCYHFDGNFNEIIEIMALTD